MAKAAKKPTSRSKHKSHAVYIEVLQNGARLCSAKRRLKRRGFVELTSEPRGDLALPYYPLPNGRLEFLRHDSEGVWLLIDHKWEGFCTTRGDLTPITRGERGQRELRLFPGDYASVSWNDLRIMVKIARPPAPEVRRPSGESYHAGPFAFIFPSRLDKQISAVAAVVAGVIVGGFVLGLLNRPYYRAKTLVDIPPSYMLSFVAPEHLATAPEALQKNLDRRNTVRSTIEYYQTLTAVLMGWRNYEARYLQPTTIIRYAAIFEKSRAALDEASERQMQVDQGQLAQQSKGVLTLPSVQGETMRGSMQRLRDKISITQAGFAMNLAGKRNFIQEFPQDPEYDYEDYRSAATATKDTKAAEYLAKAKPFARSSDEELMYAEVQQLVNEAKHRQTRLEKGLVGSQLVGQIPGAGGQPVGMPVGAKYASFVGDIDFALADEKLYQLQASEYGASPPPAPKLAREPLSGEIEPALIESFIKRNRFQLQLCYELALRRNEMASGIMEWRWRIDSRGSISNLALVSSNIRDQKMVDCIRNKINAWRFPRPRRGSIEISYPFEFAPTKG